MSRSTDDLFEPRIADWLEDDPNQAPDQVVETILAAFPSIPQRRAMRTPRRSFTMTRSAALLAGAAAVAVILVGGILFLRPGSAPGVGAASPQPLPSRTPAASSSPQAGRPDYTGLPGWIVFEHFKAKPDGSTQAGTEYGDGLWLVHADGSGLHELAPGLPAAGKTHPDISPDGTTVAFSSAQEPVQVWEAGIDSGAPSLLTTDCSGYENAPASSPQTVPCLENSPAYSPDGSRMAVVRGTPHNHALAIRDLQTHRVTLLESTRVTATKTERVLIDQPTWSPDGTQLAYYRLTIDPSGNAVDSRILIVNADGTGLHEVPLPAGTPWGDPDWSPDGSRIVLSSFPIHEFNSEQAVVYSVAPDGSDLRRLTPPGRGEGGHGAPTWTPDGKHILYWGYQTFWMMDPGGYQDPGGGNIGPINASKLTYFGDTLGYGYYGLLQPTP